VRFRTSKTCSKVNAALDVQIRLPAGVLLATPVSEPGTQRPAFSGPEAVVSDEFEALYESTYTAVVRFLYRKVWDAERAEDLAQEVFVRALAHRPEKPRAWLFAVAANLARDEARAAVRRKRHLTLLKGDPVAQPAFEPSAEDQVERDEQITAVQDALSALTPRDREILLLWDAGLSYPEIAAQTGLAVGAVGTTLARARKRLVAAHERKQTGDHAAHS
jgi:RNA polymerase sigma-70 factor, ECF subfamily